MSEEHENHGQTPAAWTAVSIVMLAFVIGTAGVIMGNMLVFWIGGVGLAIVGGIVGRVMSMMGMGLAPKPN
jgi:hypothetical protein